MADQVTAPSNRLKQLQTLAGAMPTANAAAAQGLQQARQTQLQSAIQQAPQKATPALAQQLGGQQQQQAGGIALQAQQQTQQQMGQVGQQAVAAQSQQVQAAGQQQQIALSQTQRQQAAQLHNLDAHLKNELLDKQLTFQKDQTGQSALNQRQLADWAVSKAQSAEELQSYAQQSQQMFDRNVQLLQTAQAKLQQALEQNFIIKNRPLDQSTRKQLAQSQHDMQRQIASAQAKAANNAAMWQAGGTIAGGLAGAAVAGPVGAIAGTALGGGIGSIAQATK